MSIVITSILSMIEALLPAITSSANATLIGSIITALTNMLPYIIQEVEALVGPVKNIIAALSANPATTAAQLTTLQALDVQVDNAFEAAAAQTDADGSSPTT
jgi:hypothetical protein